ncbi:MAG: hypothetical protein NE334_17910 [Lentisphaeraceae bacterium]|nr:hypothetical protein [Lentisphaeraceae bacterium]
MKAVDKFEDLLRVLKDYYESQLFDEAKLISLITDIKALSSNNKSIQKVLTLCDQILEDSESLDLHLVMELVFVLEGVILNLRTDEEFDLQPVAKVEERIVDAGSDWFLLQPLVKALELKGSGRLRLLEESVAFGTYKNRFLMPYIVQAAFDSYGPVSELILKEMLPYFGLSGTMCLSKNIEFKGTAAEERVISYLLNHLPTKDHKEFIKRAFRAANTKPLQYLLSVLKYESWMHSYLSRIVESKKGILNKLASSLLIDEKE